MCRLLVVVVPWQWEQVSSDPELSAFMHQCSVPRIPSSEWGVWFCMAKPVLSLTHAFSLRRPLVLSVIWFLFSIAFSLYDILVYVWTHIEDQVQVLSHDVHAWHTEDVAVDLCISFCNQMRLCLTSVSCGPNKSCYTTFLHLVRIIYLFRVEEGKRSLSCH